MLTKRPFRRSAAEPSPCGTGAFAKPLVAHKLAKIAVFAAFLLAMLGEAPALAAASAPEAKAVSFFSEKKISPLSDKRLKALFTKRTITFKNLETGKTRKIYYDSNPNEDVDNYYDQDGWGSNWSIAENTVTEFDKNETEKDYSIYEYDGILYVCNYPRKGYCGDIILRSMSGNTF